MAGGDDATLFPENRAGGAVTPPMLSAGALRGRPFRRDDWLLIQALQADPRSGRWLLPPGEAASEGRSRRVAEAFAESWLSDGFGPYLWLRGATPIAYAGLRRSRLRAAHEIEAVWAVLPDHWGHGVATRATRAALAADGPRPGDGLSVASWTLEDNAASRRVMEKLGFAFEGAAEWAGLPHVVYRWRPGEEDGPVETVRIGDAP